MRQENKSYLTREAYFSPEANEGHCSKLHRSVKSLGHGHVGDQVKLVVAFDLFICSSFATFFLGAVSEYLSLSDLL